MGSCFFSSDEDNDPNRLTGTVSIIGTARVGQTLTVDISALGGSGDIDYKWERESTSLYDNGHKGYTFYVVQTADVGSRITVTVRRSDNYGSVTSTTDIIIDIGGPTPGLQFTLINNGTEYSVAKGMASAAVVVIPYVHEGLPVTEIEDSGFASYKNLTSITIPDTVRSIGNNAFFNCGSLTSVIMPNSVTRINNLAFSNCGSLTAIFYGGTDSTTWARIIVGTGNTSLTETTTYYYSATVPDTANIHWHFEGEIPRIWYYGMAFSSINDWTKAPFNNAAYSVSKGDATAEVIVIPAFYEGKPVMGIENSGFASYKNLTSITIPDSVIYIGSGYRSNMTTTDNDGVFFDCTSLMNVTIPNSVGSIKAWTFYGCSSLTSIIIPNSVTSIDYSAFDLRTSNLTRVYYGGADDTAWDKINIGNGNSPLTYATRYYYSEVSKPGNYWRFVDGIPEVWDESAIVPELRGFFG
jgi:hypothetical protein